MIIQSVVEVGSAEEEVPNASAHIKRQIDRNASPRVSRLTVDL
jgi:hypothetical protein